jgi:hypothetical protein
MRRLAPSLPALILALGMVPATLAHGPLAGQLATPTAVPLTLTMTPTLLIPPISRGTPMPRRTTTPYGAPISPAASGGDIRTTATAAVATITAANATITAVLGAPSRGLETATAVPAQPTWTATPVPTVTAIAGHTAPAPARTTAIGVPYRTVVTTTAAAVEGQDIPMGALLEIPLDVALEHDAVPAGTAVRFASGRMIELPDGARLPAAENPTIIGGPLLVLLPQASLVGDTRYPAGTTLMLPSGTAVLGVLQHEATVLLPEGTVVQVENRAFTLLEPLHVVVTAIRVARSATLPVTSDDASPHVWACLGRALRRHASDCGRLRWELIRRGGLTDSAATGAPQSPDRGYAGGW